MNEGPLHFYMATITTQAKPEKAQRKSPIPQDAGRILAGALKLELKDRVDIRNELTSSIDEELKDMEAKLNEARKMITSQQ